MLSGNILISPIIIIIAIQVNITAKSKRIFCLTFCKNFQASILLQSLKVGPSVVASVLFTTSAAIHRYYESRRRLFNDEQPGRAEAVHKTKISTQKKQLRKKVSLIFESKSLTDMLVIYG